MTMVLEVNGIPYGNFKQGSISSRLDVLCNAMRFTLARDKTSPLPFREGSLCKVLIDDELVFTGSIEKLNIDYDKTNHVLVVVGRDLTGDLLDSTLEKISGIGRGTSLKDIIKIILAQLSKDTIDVLGIAGVTVEEVEKIDGFNTAADIASPETGDNAWKFIEELARKRQVLLKTDENSNIIITRSQPTVLQNGILKNVVGAEDNNIIKGSMAYDLTKRFAVYIIQTQENLIALEDERSPDLDQVVSQRGRILDSEIRKGRQMVLAPKFAAASKDNENRAVWERNIRKGRGKLYRVTVAGFRIGGVLWKINTLVNVRDDFCGLGKPDGEPAVMLINSVEFTFSLTRGSITKLTLVDKDTYTLLLDEPAEVETGVGIL